MKFLLLLFLTSCASVPQLIDLSKHYKKDMIIHVNDHTGTGVFVAPSAMSYDIDIELKEKADLLSITTCHREMIYEKVGGRKGWFSKDRKEVNITFSPILGIEDRYCPIILEAYVKDSGKHSWGFIDFDDHRHKLKAKTLCNGKLTSYKGVSVCQAREGLLQEIHFEEPVVTSKNHGCEALRGLEGKSFNYEMPKGTCVTVFKGKNSGELLRHSSFGYDNIIVREL